MTRPILGDEIDRFRGAITRRMGLVFDDTRLPMLAELLRERAHAGGRPIGEYLRRLEHAPLEPTETAALARVLTIGETYFFRNIEQFEALREVVFPACLAARASTRRLRFLSAGCASGEEPYSIAIAALERIDREWDVSVVGVDANPDALAKATRAHFTGWSLRETPAAQRRWFTAHGQSWVLDAAVQAKVSFELVNLADPRASIWQDDAYDAIFCRNMIMYFAPEPARALMARLQRSLAPHGFLFLGHAEPMRGLSEAFHLRHTHGTFYYQRRTDGEPEELPPPLELPSTTLSVDTSWVDVIRETSLRVAALGDAVQQEPPSPPAVRPSPTVGRIDLAPALERLQHERFDEGLALVEEALARADTDRGALLLQAVLLAHGGRTAEARRSCERLLSLDELDAGAYYVLALCHESSGDRREAAEADRVAIYLDPSFAMPHFHLGMLARREGEPERARRELEQAALLLAREDASRLLLFGGGFDRRALLALCAAELRACGGGR